MSRTAKIMALVFAVGVALMGFGGVTAASTEQGPAWCNGHHGAIDIIGSTSATGIGVSYGDNKSGPQGKDTDDWRHKPNSWMSQLRSEFPDSVVHNFAADHSTVADHLDYLGTVPAVVRDQPVLAIIMLGNDDWLSGVGPAAYGEGLTELVKAIHEGSPDTTMVLVNEWQISALDATGINPATTKSEYTETMKATAAKLKVDYLDLAPRLPLPHTAPPGLFASDYVHASDGANLVAASWIIAHLHHC